MLKILGGILILAAVIAVIWRQWRKAKKGECCGQKK